MSARLTIAAPFGRGPDLECRLGLERRGVEPSHARSTPIGGQNFSVVGDGAGNARKSWQRRDVLLGVVVDDLDAVARGVRDEHAPGFGIERGMIELAARSAGYFDDAKRF